MIVLRVHRDYNKTYIVHCMRFDNIMQRFDNNNLLYDIFLRTHLA